MLVLGSIPKSAVRFGAYEQFKSMRVDKNGNLAPFDRLICGLGAGIFEAILAVTPTETIKVKFINDQRSRNPKYRGLFHGVKSIVAEQGLKGTYQGLSATIMKQGSNQVRNNFFLLFTKYLMLLNNSKPLFTHFLSKTFIVSALSEMISQHCKIV